MESYYSSIDQAKTAYGSGCFKLVTGYTIGEYLRNRRLYLAGLEVLGKKAPGGQIQHKGVTCGNEEGKIIDMAYKYGYDTPESFTKAFTRFHGLSPMQLRAHPHRLKFFLPLIVEISVRGGTKMDFRIEKSSGIAAFSHCLDVKIFPNPPDR